MKKYSNKLLHNLFLQAQSHPDATNPLVWDAIKTWSHASLYFIVKDQSERVIKQKHLLMSESLHMPTCYKYDFYLPLFCSVLAESE